MFLSLISAVLIVPSGIAFDCTPTEVWDGDGPIWCSEGPKVRLAGIAAREMDGGCRQNQPCPPSSAVEARDTLVALVGMRIGQSQDGHILVKGSTLKCVSNGGAGGSRTAAWCTSPTIGDISCAMVRSGSAMKWDRYWGAHLCNLPR